MQKQWGIKREGEYVKLERVQKVYYSEGMAFLRSVVEGKLMEQFDSKAFGF